MSYHEMIFHSLAGVEEVKMEPLDYMERTTIQYELVCF